MHLVSVLASRWKESAGIGHEPGSDEDEEDTAQYAAGVPQVAGRSGGAHEAVAHGETGLVVDDPTDPSDAAEAIGRLLRDAELRAQMAAAGRERAVREFGYDVLAARLEAAIDAMVAP